MGSAQQLQIVALAELPVVGFHKGLKQLHQGRFCASVVPHDHHIAIVQVAVQRQDAQAFGLGMGLPVGGLQQLQGWP